MSNPTYITSDLRNACFLLARGHPFLGADSGKGRVKFIFACSTQDAGLYFSSDDTVSARQLFSAWHSLRTLIDDARAGPNKNRSMNNASFPSHQ